MGYSDGVTKSQTRVSDLARMQWLYSVAFLLYKEVTSVPVSPPSWTSLHPTLNISF